MCALVEALLLLNREDSKSSPTSGTLMKTYYLQILNALVYQLYFSDEFRSRCPDLFGILSEVNLRDIEAGDESRRLARLGELFEVLYAPSHPVRAALYALGSLEVVRIIEGQK